ncbi:glycosyltransferase [candidate division KSB1 bacterium]|nr:glycosyltransferase [candidate division KSB1 bacterium]
MVTLLQIMLILLVFAYISQILYLLYGTRKIKYPRQFNFEPVVSIIVAARNEILNLPICLDSLLKLDYPPEKLEIILVNDHSIDSTLDIMNAYARQNSIFRVYSVDQVSSKLSGKANAVAFGISKSRGEIIILTDADCQVPAEWVREYVSYFDQDIGLVAGITLLDSRKEKGKISGKIQSLDWLYLLSIGISSARNRIPLSCVGNNVAFRRNVYDQIGGFTQLGFSITEDFALLNAIIKLSNWKVRFSFSRKLLVLSQPIYQIRELFHQRKRWASGSQFVRFFGKLLILIGGLAHIFLPLSLFDSNLVLPGLAGILTIVLFDFLFLWRTTHLLNRKDLLKFFLLFEVYFFIYTTFFAFALLLSRKVQWKGIIYDLKKRKMNKSDVNSSWIIKN